MHGIDSKVSERQAPLRRQYAHEPEAAISPKWARTSSTNLSPGDPFHVDVEIGREHTLSLRLGVDHRVGGLGDLPNPGDLLCAALAACADVAIRMVADLLGVQLDMLEVEVSGTVDVRGALALDPDVRVGFQSLESRVRLRAARETPARLIDQLMKAAKRACVNLDTLQRGTTVELIVGESS